MRLRIRLAGALHSSSRRRACRQADSTPGPRAPSPESAQWQASARTLATVLVTVWQPECVSLSNSASEPRPDSARRSGVARPGCGTVSEAQACKAAASESAPATVAPCQCRRMTRRCGRRGNDGVGRGPGGGASHRNSGMARRSATRRAGLQET